jgi:branched-chain amino acid transport system substrate-binding protein
MRLLSLLPCLALAVLLGSCGNDDKDDGEIKVGVVLPMSGGRATFGAESWNGMQLAYEELEAKGALKVPFNLVRKDDQSKDEEAGTAAKTLVDTVGVTAILGSVASGSTSLVFTQCRQAGVPGISPASTRDDITVEGGPYCSRICFKDSFQGSVLAQFAWGRGWKKAAVVEDKSAPYAVGLAESFRKSFAEAGGTVTREFYQDSDTDFSNVVQNVARTSPDVVFIAGYYKHAGLMLKQAIGKWDGKPVMGGDGLDSPDLKSLSGGATNDVYVTSHFAPDDPDPVVQDFSKRYREKYGKAPGAMSALGYDVILVLEDALTRVKDPRDRKALAEAIARTSGVAGVTGKINLTTPDRTPVKPAVVLQQTATGFRHVQTVQPQPAKTER